MLVGHLVHSSSDSSLITFHSEVLSNVIVYYHCFFVQATRMSLVFWLTIVNGMVGLILALTCLLDIGVSYWDLELKPVSSENLGFYIWNNAADSWCLSVYHKLQTLDIGLTGFCSACDSKWFTWLFVFICRDMYLCESFGIQEESYLAIRKGQVASPFLESIWPMDIESAC